MRPCTTAALLLATAVLALAGCGGSGGGSTASTTTASAPSPAAANTTATAPKPTKQGDGSRHPGGSDSSASPSGEGSAAFRTPGGDNSIQEFGSEAGASERQAAAATLQGYLTARAGGEWSKACAYLAATTQKSLEQLAAGSKKLKGSGCAPVLAALSAGLPPSARGAGMPTSGVAALRVKGEQAFAIYRGAHGVAYNASMAREGGHWKLAALAPSTLP